MLLAQVVQNSLSFYFKDPLSETSKRPSSGTVTLNGEQELDGIDSKSKGSRGKEVVDGSSGEVSPLKMNLTVVNSTFNHTATQEVRTFYNKVCQL